MAIEHLATIDLAHASTTVHRAVLWAALQARREIPNEPLARELHTRALEAIAATQGPTYAAELEHELRRALGHHPR